jgi:hypothetical protein
MQILNGSVTFLLTCCLFSFGYVEGCKAGDNISATETLAKDLATVAASKGICQAGPPYYNLDLSVPKEGALTKCDGGVYHENLILGAETPSEIESAELSIDAIEATMTVVLKPYSLSVLDVQKAFQKVLGVPLELQRGNPVDHWGYWSVTSGKDKRHYWMAEVRLSSNYSVAIYQDQSAQFLRGIVFIERRFNQIYQ